MRKHLFTHALVASIVVPLGMAGHATAAGSWLPELLKILPELKEILDVGSKLATNDVPSLVSANADLPERARRAAKFHPGHLFEKAPIIDGDRMFSRAPGIRVQMREQYADFVQREARDIAQFKQRRDEQAKQLANYERAYERLVNVANKAPDLIVMTSKVPLVNEVLPNQIGAALLEAEQAKPIVSDIVTEYRRIVREYDAKVKEAEFGHAAHVSMLGIIDTLQLPPEASGKRTGSDQQKRGSTAMPTESRPGYAEGIKSTVENAIAPVESRAWSSSNATARDLQQVGPPPQMPSSMPTISVPIQSEPSWTGTITPYVSEGQ